MLPLSLSIEQICRLVQGTTSLDQSMHINDLASLSSATVHDLAVVLPRGDGSPFDELSLTEIAQSSAGVILAESELVSEKVFIVVPDALHAYTQLVNFVENRAARYHEEIHSTAIIAANVQLGAGVIIEPYVTIQAGAVIGSYSRIGAHTTIGASVVIGEETIIGASVFLHDHTVVGNQTIIQAGALIGTDGFGYQVAKTSMRRIPHIGTVRIGNRVEIGAGCCIDRATFDETVIGDGVKLDNMVHVAHNVHIGAGTAILAQTVVGGGAVIESECQIGGHVAIKDHVVIGRGARVVSKSAVIKNVAPGMTVAGQPAMHFRVWKRTLAALNQLVAPRVQAPSRIAMLKGVVWHKVRGWFSSKE